MNRLNVDSPRARTLTYRFLRLAHLHSGVFKRLNRYEAALWRQAVQTMATLRAIQYRYCPSLAPSDFLISDSFPCSIRHDRGRVAATGGYQLFFAGASTYLWRRLANTAPRCECAEASASASAPPFCGRNWVRFISKPTVGLHLKKNYIYLLV
jgi:hypothetical protein